ncbi:putative cellulase [Aspergillus californicus]
MGSHTNQRTMLRVSGKDIVDATNTPVILKGAALGGFLNMENFITGYPGHEHEVRHSMASVLGKEKAQFFFDRLLHHFFTDKDAEFFASLGLNCIRLPFNYRHFIDDRGDPTHFKQSGFDLLDRVIDICRRHDLYVILDLHAVPGGQNQDWHCDSGLPRALFWEFKVFQDQAINLWVAIAKRYADEPIIAGYNPLNEPADPSHIGLLDWYDRAHTAIRAVDRNHILFLDGNTYAMDFSHFDRVLPNAVYSCHDYAMLGFPIPGQGLYTGTDQQKAKLNSSLTRKIQFMRDWNVPIWNGEFGPVYPDARKEENAQETLEARIDMLREQLRIYDTSSISWSIWTYKDIGYQGMVYVNPETPYMKLVSEFVEKKLRLGVDFWGCADKEGVKGLYEPFIAGLKKMIPGHLLTKKYPPVWTFDRQVERVVREGLVSEYLTWEYAELFEGKSKAELEELAASFAFENCVERKELSLALVDDVNRGLHP